MEFSVAGESVAEASLIAEPPRQANRFMDDVRSLPVQVATAASVAAAAGAWQPSAAAGTDRPFAALWALVQPSSAASGGRLLLAEARPRRGPHSAFSAARVGAAPTRRDLFLQLRTFATCTHDRVFLLNDRLRDFSVEITNEQLLSRMLEQGAGCFLMGAHLGSFELLRAVGKQYPKVKAAMVMYAEMPARSAPPWRPLIPTTYRTSFRSVHDAMLQVRARLDQGAFVGVLGDRTLGDEPVLSVNFLGSPAKFPVGPWRAAALLRRPVLFFAGLYCGGNRYRIIVEQLADFSHMETSTRESAIHEAIVRYAALLESSVVAIRTTGSTFLIFGMSSPLLSPPRRRCAHCGSASSGTGRAPNAPRGGYK